MVERTAPGKAPPPHVRYSMVPEEHLAAVLDEVLAMTSEAISLADPDRRFIAISRGFCRLTGFPADRLLGQPTSILYRNNEKKFAQVGRLLRSMSPGAEQTFRIPAPRPDGAVQILAFRGRVLHGPGNVTVGYLGKATGEGGASHARPTKIDAVVDGGPPVVGKSRLIQALLEDCGVIARYDVPVLVVGETGTGKELIARRLHAASPRHFAPFVAVNCASIPTTLFESELFGVEKGAFTGAERTRSGRVESAEGGTLFLDEVGELPLQAQSKLLRFLQDFEYQRVGGSAVRKADVRVVCATNRDLERATRAGGFREDLLYRIRVSELEVPALRRRTEDIEPLLRHFIDTYHRPQDPRVTHLAPSTVEAFRDYAWPGNVRELENVVRAELPFCRDGVFQLHRSRLRTRDREDSFPSDEKDGLNYHAHRRRLLVEALRRSGGIVDGAAGAARKLGLPASTVRGWVKDHGLEALCRKKHGGA